MVRKRLRGGILLRLSMDGEQLGVESSSAKYIIGSEAHRRQ